MLGRISSIKFPLSEYNFVHNGEKLDHINGLSKINLFVGPNNSGKSRLLRSFVKSELEYRPYEPDFFEIRKKFLETKDKIESDFPPAYKAETNIKAILEQLENIGNLQFLSPTGYNFNTFNSALSALPSRPGTEYDLVPPKLRYKEKAQVVSERFKTIVDEGLNAGIWNIQDYFQPKKYRRLYIPILRNLRIFVEDKGDEEKNIFKKQFKKEYFNDTGEKVEIITGADFYSLVKKRLLGSHKSRTQIKKYEDFLSRYFFDNEGVALIPHEDEGILHIKIGKETQRPIHELGDGLQSLIIMTYAIYLHQGQNGIVVIEEPELFLHPGSIRNFINAILTDEAFIHYQFFMSTHSNHLLDLSLDYQDTSTFSVRKEIPKNQNDENDASFVIQAESYGSEQSLAFLGVRNSSVYLTNCTVWVEGITDRLYLRKFLSLLPLEYEFKKIQEDIHYSIVEYAGSNITHWSFLDEEVHPVNVDRLCGRSFIIVDKDEAKDDRHTEIARLIGNSRLQVLPVREIENLLSPDILFLTCKKYLKKGEEIDSKGKLKEKEYSKKRLGPVLDQKYSIDHKFKGKYNTLSGKVTFCHRAIDEIKEWGDLTTNAQQLAIKIANFIRENNGHEYIK